MESAPTANNYVPRADIILHTVQNKKIHLLSQVDNSLFNDSAVEDFLTFLDFYACCESVCGNNKVK